MKRNGFNYGFNSRGHKNKHSESRRKESIKTKTEINTFKRKVELINWQRAYFKKINKRDKLLENLIAKKKKSEKRLKHTALKIRNLALAGVLQWVEHRLGTKGLPVQFPVRAHAWVVGQVPSGHHLRGNHTLMFLSLSFSLPYPL